MDKYIRRLPPKPNITKLVEDEKTKPSTSTIPAAQGVTALSDSNPTSKLLDSNTKPSSSKTTPAEPEHPATSSVANIETVQLDNVPESEKEFLGVEPPAKKIKQVYKFNDDWLLLSSFCKWLEKKEEKDKEPTAFCKLCEVTIANHKPVLERHMTTTKHQTNANAIQHTKHIGDGDLIKKTSGTSRDQARWAKIKLTAFLAEHNLPLSLTDSLVPLTHSRIRRLHEKCLKVVLKPLMF